MGGAILVHAPAYHLFVRRGASPVLRDRFRMPARTELTVPLVGGAAIFGVGWGLGGFCPGPGLVSLPTFGTEALTFFGSMSLGMVLHHLLTRSSGEGAPTSGSAGSLARSASPGSNAVDH